MSSREASEFGEGAPAELGPELLELHGELVQTNLGELLRALFRARKSGVLNLSTKTGDGAIWLERGGIADASYRQFEGKKALFRLFGETDAVYSFVDSQSTDWLRRLDADTETLVAEGLQALAHVRSKVSALSLDTDAFARTKLESKPTERPVPRDASSPPSQPLPASELEGLLLAVLSAPRTLTELLDLIPALDVEIVDAVVKLLGDGTLRRLPNAARKIAGLEPETLARLIWRKQRPGFRGPPRIGVAASDAELAIIQLHLGRLIGAHLPIEPVSASGCPHLLATWELAEGVELELFGVPLNETYAPLWGVFFPGLLSLLVLTGTRPQALERACEAAALTWVDVHERVPSLEALDPSQLSVLIRQCVEAASE
ncbi:MAG TPA: DUF4388 domain-containing protein [Polyangiaceae bacterium]|nr:DUF4388 domain-containing protein [Polyangiaceae bacterium]